MQKASRGFTLIEMMIVVVILGILVGIALPSYQEHVRKGYRAEGQAFLNDVAARQERYASQNNTYITSDSDRSKLGVDSQSQTKRYTLTLSSTNDYTLTATPTFSDPKCGNLTLDARGVRDVTSGDKDYCWR
ncbi:MAG: type IV pilin protein [Gammaproteobacteria bacterium]|nr:type IV pilin protein [Gammaproteobacteria bacterium]